jgi:hypothetical protein
LDYGAADGGGGVVVAVVEGCGFGAHFGDGWRAELGTYSIEALRRWKGRGGGGGFIEGCWG